MVGEVCEYDELAGIYEKLDTVRISTSESEDNEEQPGLRLVHLPSTID
jgi:hypothetical protein